MTSNRSETRSIDGPWVGVGVAVFLALLAALRARIEADAVNALCAVGSVSLMAITAADHLEAWPPAAALPALVVLRKGD